MKREIPLLITAVMGIFLIIQAFIPHPPINEIDSTLNDFALIVFVFTMILGVLNLLYMNFRKVESKKAGWGYSLVTLAAFFTTAFFGLVNPAEESNLIEKLIETNTKLVKVICEDVAKRKYNLEEKDAKLAAAILVKIHNPGIIVDSKVLADNNVNEDDVEQLVSYDRIVHEKFAAIFNQSGMSLDTFEAFEEDALDEVRLVLADTLPLGRELIEYSASIVEVLVDNDDFTDLLFKQAKNNDKIDKVVIFTRAKAATQPLYEFKINAGDEKLSVETVYEPLLHRIVDRGIENIEEAISIFKDDGELDKIKPEMIVSAFGSDSTVKTIFNKVDDTANPFGRAVIQLATTHLPKHELSPQTFLSAISAVFGKAEVEPKFELKPLEKGSGFQWIFDNIYDPLTSTMFALLAFFIASAAYRAFRVRSSDAALLLGAGFIVMLGQIPLGNYLTAWLPEWAQMSDIADWIMMYPNMASQRAIMIGVALGVISTALKIIIGIERGYLGGGD